LYKYNYEKEMAECRKAKKIVQKHQKKRN
jgi:hypothetical protein